MLILTYVAEIVGELTLVSLTGQIWALPFIVYLVVVNSAQANRWVMFTVISLLLSYPNGELSSTAPLRFPRPCVRVRTNCSLLNSSPDPGGMELPQLKCRSLADCFSGLLQYVCPGWRDYSF